MSIGTPLSSQLMRITRMLEGATEKNNVLESKLRTTNLMYEANRTELEYQRILNENLQIVVDNLEKNAKRYEWIESRKYINLRSERVQWTRSDGTKFTSSHYLAADGKLYGSAETLDATIDLAMAYDI